VGKIPDLAKIGPDPGSPNNIACKSGKPYLVVRIHAGQVGEGAVAVQPTMADPAP
jgi:hypothetical protein